MQPRIARPVANSLFGIALVGLVVGCGSDSGGGDDDIAPDPITITWGPRTIPAGEEDVMCVIKRLGNTETLHIKEMINDLGGVSHHLIVYRTNENEEQLTPQPCDSVENLVDTDKGVPLMISQTRYDDLVLPEGVAFELEENQMIRLELHYINAADTPVDVEVTSTFIPMAPSEFVHAADLLFMGDPDINLPPRSEATLGPIYMPRPIFGDEPPKFFGITGHQHQWGTNVQVAIADSQQGPETMVYDLPNFDWDEPETVYFSPPFEVPDTGGFKYTCTWFNGSDDNVYFGEGVDDEMCFFWTYYYPSVGSKTCFHTEQATGSPLDVCCPGDQLCNLIEDYLDNGL